MKTIGEASALAAAIRAFTVDAPNDEPNGPMEASLLALRFALGRGDMKSARRYYREMCSQMSDDTKTLRVAAEGYFGGDFRKGPPS